MRRVLTWFRWPDPAADYPFLPPAYVFVFLCLNIASWAFVVAIVAHFLKNLKPCG